MTEKAPHPGSKLPGGVEVVALLRIEALALLVTQLIPCEHGEKQISSAVWHMELVSIFRVNELADPPR
jgi:hypothetical protein